MVYLQLKKLKKNYYDLRSKKVDNLIATVDLNGKQIDGSTDDVLPMGNIAQKFEAFGWEVLLLEEGNDLKSITKRLKLAQTKTGKGRLTWRLEGDPCLPPGLLLRS